MFEQLLGLRRIPLTMLQARDVALSLILNYS
jgi:hypothetical protein